MIIATLSTVPVHGTTREGGAEIGQYILPIKLNEGLFRQQLRKRKYLMTTLATHLGTAILDTKIPASMWQISFVESIAREFSLPSSIRLDALDDISSLTIQ